MNSTEVLLIVLREMTAVGHGWRVNWSDFDGQKLCDQLNRIAAWAELALAADVPSDFTEGNEFVDKQLA